MTQPVLIYIAKEGCPACIAFQPEWEKIKQRLRGKAHFVKFVCDPPRVVIPSCLAKYATWYPSIILAGPKSYYKKYTHDDRVLPCDGHTIKAKKYNAVETSYGYEYAGRPNNADNVVMWYGQVVDKVLREDA